MVLPGELCHRLVAAAWCGLDIDDPTQVVDHIDGNRSNNLPSNLRVLSRKEHVSATLAAGQYRDRSGNVVPPLPDNYESVLSSVREGRLSTREAGKQIGRSHEWVAKRTASNAPPVPFDPLWKSYPSEKSIEFNAQGQVRDVYSKRLISPTCSDGGYYKVRGVYVHRAVLELFGPPAPRPGALVRHGPDHDKANNRLDNLSWGTYADNGKDMKTQGRSTVGEKHGRARLTDAQVQEGLRLHVENQWTTEQLGEHLGLDQGNAAHIVTGKSWAHVPRPENWEDRRSIGRGMHHSHLDEQILADAFKLAAENEWGSPKFAEYLGISGQTAIQIYAGKTWQHVPRPKALLDQIAARSQRLPDETIIEGLKLAESKGWGAPTLAKHLGVSVATASALIAGKSYAHIKRVSGMKGWKP